MKAELTELYQSILMSHNKSPKRYGPPSEGSRVVEGYNSLCGDRVTIAYKHEGGVLTELTFESAACSICKASASILMQEACGHSIATFEDRLLALQEIVDGSRDNCSIETESELAAFSGIVNFPARKTCALLPWNTLRDELRKDDPGNS